MFITGTTIGFACAIALLLAAIFSALLERKEKKQGNTDKSRFLSRLALVLFLVSFVGGTAVVLLSGIQPRDAARGIGMGKPMGEESGAPASDSKSTIGQVNEEEYNALKKHIEENPKDVKALERLGHLSLQLKDFDAVIDLSEKALTINPKSAESLTHLGMAYSAIQDQDKAMEMFNQALKADPKFTEALLFKGIVQFQEQDLKGAQETWNTFLKVAKPNDPGRHRVEMFLKAIEKSLADQKQTSLKN